MTTRIMETKVNNKNKSSSRQDIANIPVIYLSSYNKMHILSFLEALVPNKVAFHQLFSKAHCF